MTCAPSAERRPTRLSALVGEYRRECAPWLAEQLRHFREVDLEEAIRKAALGLRPDGKRHDHQRRLERAALESAARKLFSARGAIEACQTFEELHGLVEKLTKPIWGFGPLARYDTALRIGARVGRLPNLIFLHAGTKKGFRRLGLRTKERAVPLEMLPAPLRVLKPHEAEDFLCIYKNRLRP